jgi:hypothetical protein
MFQVSDVLLKEIKYIMVLRTEKITRNSNIWCVDYSIEHYQITVDKKVKKSSPCPRDEGI